MNFKSKRAFFSFRRNQTTFTALLFFISAVLAFPAVAFEGLDLINKTNWPHYFTALNKNLNNKNGNISFWPTDIYLLSKTLPQGIPFKIRKFDERNELTDIDHAKIPLYYSLIPSQEDIEKMALYLKNNKTSAIVFPYENQFILWINGSPFARVEIAASRQTVPGNFLFWGITPHNLYSKEYPGTIMPFGSPIRKINGIWAYQDNNSWKQLPANILNDIELPLKKRNYQYYDESFDKEGKTRGARWAGNELGKYIFFWSPDGKYRAAQMGYSPGESVFEQIIAVKDLVYLLAAAQADTFEESIAGSPNLSLYKKYSEFIESKGKIIPDGLSPKTTGEYKLYRGWEASSAEIAAIDPLAVKAVKEFTENRLPRNRGAREKALACYSQIVKNGRQMEANTAWYAKLKKDWPFLLDLRAKLKNDFNAMGIFSTKNRQNVLENWFNQRLEYKLAAPPEEARYVSELTFASFFKPIEKQSVFIRRESQLMLDYIRKAISGEANNLSLSSVNALNNYNFGRLLNEILGNLYKSHGCLHVSPRNSRFLFDSLPIKSRIDIYPYDKSAGKETISHTPLLSDLVNFKTDLEQLKLLTSATAEVRIEVYPSDGDWIIYLKDKPFARLSITGGPKQPMYVMQERDIKGKPVFEPNIAYPTVPGKYFVFDKIENYVSNLYPDTTSVPMGGLIKKENKGWIFIDKYGKAKPLPKSIAEDINRPSEAQKFTFYDVVRNASGEALAAKWGSHPFGRHALRISLNQKTPSPQLVHSSGDLIMEERGIVNDLIDLFSLPFDSLDECIQYSSNFNLYKECYSFISSPEAGAPLHTIERASYKAYYGFALSSQETKSLPADVLAAAKVLHNAPLNETDKKILLDKGIARTIGGKFILDQKKIAGLNFDTYQYAVTIEKYANHYATLKRYWRELNSLRRAMLSDFNNFVIKDPALFHNFMRELMLRRVNLEYLSQQDAFLILYNLLEESQKI